MGDGEPVSTPLSQCHRRAAHGRHQCSLCLALIAQGELYEDQRVADSGTAYTLRSHLSCVSAFRSWDPDYDDGYLLGDLSGGHIPPCLLAWRNASGPCACPVVNP